MNVYVLSKDAKDAELVVNRLTDQEVSNAAGEDGEPIFRMYPNACEFDKETSTWKSNMASPPRLEEMDTDGLPDYEADTDNDDGYRVGAAKKIRLFSRSTTSSYSGQCLPNAAGPNTSQTYTGAFENSNADTGRLRKDILHLSIFLISWRAKISGILHRLFLTTVGIYILAVNTESYHKEDYRDSLMRMLDSFWAYTRGKDNRFPKVIIAATTFIKETSSNICQDISFFLSDLLMGKPYEYLLKGEVCLISQYLKHDQTKDLKRLINELLQNIPPEASISNQIIEKFECLRKTGKKVMVQRPFDSAESSLDVGDEDLSYLHATRLIFRAHRKSPKWVVLDPDFLVSLFQKIVEHDSKARRINQDPETGQIRFYRETDLKKIIGSENGDVILETMLDFGLLAKALKNARPDNLFVVINNGEVPVKLQSLRYLPNQKECPHFHSPVLCFKFKDACIVESAFRLMICRLLCTYPYETQGKRILLYRDFAAFKVPKDNQEKQRLSLLIINDYIFVFILAYTTRPGSIESKLCVEIRKLLEDAIREGFEAEQITESDASNGRLVTEKRIVEYENFIRCLDMEDEKLDDEGLISLSELLREISTVNEESASYTCSNHSDKPQPHNVDVVSLVRPWFPEKLKDHADVDVTSTPTLAPAVNDYRCLIKLDQILVAKIAKCIGQGWQLLAYDLGIDKPTLDKITEDNPRNTEKAMTDMLMKCVQDRKGHFTLQDVRKCIEATNVTVNWDEFNKLYEYEVNRN